MASCAAAWRLRRHGTEENFTFVLARCTYTLDRLPPIDYSELVRDLEYAAV